MQIDRVTLIYFSPTGGTRALGRLIAGEFRVPVDEIDITAPVRPRPREFCAGELVVVAVPCFGGRVPVLAAQRLVYFAGRSTPAIPVVSFGNRAYDDALRELGDILTGNGFISVAAAAAVTEHSMARQYGAGRPDEQDRAELRAFAIKTRVKLGGLLRAADGQVQLDSDEPYRKMGVPTVHPVTGRGCSGCGVCAQKCPSGAIEHDDPTRMDASLCTCCMLCVSVCKRGVRNLPKAAQMAVALKLKSVCSDRKDNALIL